MLLETSQQVKFNRVYFTIFKANGVKDIDFWEDFVFGNSNKLQKLGLEGKLVEPSRCLHLGQPHMLQY